MSADAQHRRAGTRPRYPWLYAIPSGHLPAHLACGGRAYSHVATFKHDFFAATGLYRRDIVGGASGAPQCSGSGAAEADLAVLKLNRTGGFFGLPLRWAGRFLARREIALYRAAAGLRGVPDLLGPVGDTGLMHAYVPGHPLDRREQVGDAFFDELLALLRALHARGIAYVDLNKRQNILMGDDGRPYLIDFQISLRLPQDGRGRSRPMRWLLRRFQQGDIYHVLKHKRRLRPDLLTTEEAEIVDRLSLWIRLHRLVARPLTHLRRLLLRRLRSGEESVVAGSGAK
ncbi:MAG: hypothetical protein AB1716_05515 [Planctomycetota bacterium]